jgi:hypothetical protein
MPDMLVPADPVTTFVNAGCGPPGGHQRLPPLFGGWQEIRVDLDPEMKPDIVASITDLSRIPTGCIQAVWAAHCLEHLYAHEVPLALSEFRRVLLGSGFICIVVPDLQAIASWIANDRLHETIYESPAGPITAHDMLWGYGAAIQRGSLAMAHRCGFTPTGMLQYLEGIGFAEIVIRRRTNLELVAIAFCQPQPSREVRDVLIARLGF